MKKVFLDDLPKWKGNNKYNGKIKWKDCIGCKFSFVYDEFNGEIDIVDYDGGYLTLQYKDKTLSITTGNLQKCFIGELIGITNKEHKYQIGEVLDDRKFGKLKITNQIRIKNGKSTQKGYEYKCLICGNEDNVAETAITRGNGCPVCASNKALKGYNDLWTLEPEIAKLLKYPDRGHMLSRCSNVKEIFVCLNCNREQERLIPSITKYGFSCIYCGDGISYPEKFVSELLNQLNIDHTRQEKFDWAKDKRYDFYIQSLNCIIETHGIQHYDFRNKFDRSLEEEQENDRLKEQLARENGIERYIVIDCRYSELKWIKNSILNSELNEMYDLSNINWLKCHEYSCNSLVKEVCNLWESGINSTSEICKIMNLNSTTTINKYLKQGAKLGWCDYDSKKSHLKTLKNNGILNGIKQSKPVIRFTLDGNLIDEFTSAGHASNILGINAKVIASVCRGTGITAGGYKWMYKSDYEINKNSIKFKDNKNMRKIVQFTLEGEFIKEWDNMTEPSKKLCIDRSGINHTCLGSQNSSGGFRWMYKEDYEKMTQEQNESSVAS